MMCLRQCLMCCIFLMFVMLPLAAQAQRGCCSHHGGVDYCDGKVGSLVCRDGTYSPSCGCAKDTSPQSFAEHAQQPIAVQSPESNSAPS